MNTSVLPVISQIIRSQLVDRNMGMADRRAFPRYAVTLTVRCRELDAGLEPAGEEFDAVAHDISEGGVSLITGRPVTSNFVSIAFQDAGWQDAEVVVRIVRTREFGSLTLIAGPFVQI
ncbi:hypothetical protein GC176_22795 [bacterium]|nr:hypothetical protein [bacterium]